jgi:hypothetical protein
MARVTNCDSQLFQSTLGGNANSLMIAIDQTPDTNSESRRLADNLLARAADVFCANGQRIYRRADRTRKITYDDKDQMQELIDLYLVETAPMLDGLGEAIQTSSSGEVARITRELVGSSLYWGPEAFTRPLGELERLAHAGDLPGHTRCLPIFAREFRLSGAPSRNLSKHCRPPIHNR